MKHLNLKKLSRVVVFTGLIVISSFNSFADESLNEKVDTVLQQEEFDDSIKDMDIKINNRIYELSISQYDYESCGLLSSKIIDNVKKKMVSIDNYSENCSMKLEFSIPVGYFTAGENIEKLNGLSERKVIKVNKNLNNWLINMKTQAVHTFDDSNNNSNIEFDNKYSTENEVTTDLISGNKIQEYFAGILNYEYLRNLEVENNDKYYKLYGINYNKDFIWGWNQYVNFNDGKLNKDKVYIELYCNKDDYRVEHVIIHSLPVYGGTDYSNYFTLNGIIDYSYENK